MITTNDILNIARHVVRRGNGIPDRRAMHPVRDWFIGLFVATLCFAAGSVYAGVLFIGMYNGVAVNAPIDDRVVAYKAELISDVLMRYRERADHFEQLRGARQAPVPVSLIVNEAPETNIETEASEVRETTQ